MQLADLATADAVIALVVLVSAVFGLLRGFVKEVLALMIWVGAALLGMRFGPTIAEWLDVGLSERLRNAIGFAALFVVVLVAGAMLQRLLRTLVQGTGLTGTDRTLGLLFGTVRGVAVVTIALVLLQPFVGEKIWWDDSRFAPPLLALESDVLEIVNGALDLVGADPVAPWGNSAIATAVHRAR